MSHPIVGEVVLIRIGNRTQAALVLSARHVPDHAGSQGEPLLSLVSVRLDKTGRVGGPEELAQFHADVAHVSHAWDARQQRLHGAAAYGGPRWEDEILPLPQPVPAPTPQAQPPAVEEASDVRAEE